MVSTDPTSSQVSPPKAPAFMQSAPPRVPGIPARNSAPVRPSCAANLAMRAHEAPAWATMARSAMARSVMKGQAFKRAVLITVPLSPPSRTRRLLPSPTHKSGSSLGVPRRKHWRSSASAGTKKRRARPPARHEVWRAMGSSRRSAPRTSATPVPLSIAPALRAVSIRPHTAARRRARAARGGRAHRCCRRRA